MRDKGATPAARVSAATAILDRAYGKPAQTVNANVVRTVLDVSDAELAAIAHNGSQGALFGPLWGTVVNLVGGTLGAALAFLAARYLAADWVARRAGGRLRQVVEGVEAEGWRFVALVRLVPLIPFNLAKYALGLRRIPLG